jgi:hypothetical protein
MVSEEFRRDLKYVDLNLSVLVVRGALFNNDMQGL